MHKPKFSGLPIFKRGNRFILQTTFKRVGQKQVPLGNDEKIAIAKGKRFLLTAEHNGFECALEELHGKPVIKRGDDPTFDQMEVIYRQYCAQSDSPPRETTIKHSLGCLKRIMGETKTISKIDIVEVRKRLLTEPDNPTKRRSFVTQCRCAKSIFKKRAMGYFKSKGLTVTNPFVSMELSSPKVEQYSPLSKELRESIWNDCEKELPAQEAMIVILGLGLAFRRSEIEACRTSWFSIQDDYVMISVKEESDYTPKSGETRTFKVTKDLYERLQKLRSQCSADGSYFVPVVQRKNSGKRLWRRFKAVSGWLKKKGVVARCPIHCLRKEAGTVILKNTSLLEASRILGHSDPSVTATHYAGLIDISPIGGITTKNPLEDAAAQLGLTLEDMMKKLSA